MKRLPITLWSCVRTDNYDHWCRVARVLRYCMRLFEFEEVVLFSFLHPIGEILPQSVKLVQIPMLDIDQFNIFVNRIAPSFLFDKADYSMSVHEDGFILNPELWSDEFLKYDYVGARWADGVVGNGGFNIESVLLAAKKFKLPFYEILVNQFDGRSVLPSDVYLCREHRAALEAQGIRFASAEVADRFSAEQRTIAEPTLGFHGRKCKPEFYVQGWKQIEESER